MSDRATDAILAALTPVIEGLAATFGPACEVVLHDCRRGDRSVVAVAGQVTGRQVGGALNLDVTALRQAGDLLSAPAGAAPARIPTTTFANDFDEVVDVMVRAEVLARGNPIVSLTRGKRLDLLRAFDERAVFAVRNAVPRVAARLGASRSAIYADLAKCRGTVIEGPEREES
ncbi:PAS domain-containing protein [Streptomyces sp. NPDC058086]|uniref:PAS domain-containing protein n=1 Tax=Streptomyces sp. NPDC058086 TaxID=3346334 RepID=UPI0036EEF57E